MQIAAAFSCTTACAGAYAPTALAAANVDTRGRSKAKIVDIVDFGAKGDGEADSQAAIQRAFDYAKAGGRDVFIPEGTFIHSGTLTADGIKVFGGGRNSVLKASTYGAEAIILKGDHVCLTDMHMIGVGAGRHRNLVSCQVLVDGASNFTIQRVHIERTSGAAIVVTPGYNGYIADNLIEHTKADSIHMRHGSHDIVVERNRIEYSGDDGISVVSYGGGADNPVNHLTIRDNKVLYNTWGRGISVVGGSDILIEHNLFTGGTADRAGIYLAAESSYNTQSVHNVRVTGNTLIDAGGVTSGHGAIHVYNSQSGLGLVNDGITITANEIINPRRVGIAVTGSGVQKIAAYDNTLVGGSYGLIGINASHAHVSSFRPETEKNIGLVEGGRIIGARNGK